MHITHGMFGGGCAIASRVKDLGFRPGIDAALVGTMYSLLCTKPAVLLQQKALKVHVTTL